MATHDFLNDGNVYYTSLEFTDGVTNRNIQIPMSTNNTNTLCPQDIKIMYPFRRISYSSNNSNYAYVSTAGWTEIPTGSKTGSPSSSSSTNVTYNLTDQDFVKYTSDSNWWWTQFILPTRNVIFPAGYTININVSRHICNMWSDATVGFRPAGYCFHAYTSNSYNVYGVLSLGTTYTVRSETPQTCYIYAGGYASGKSTNWMTINPGDTWMIKVENSSWTGGSPSRRIYYRSTDVYGYKNGVQQFDSYASNSSTGGYPSTPASYYFAYARASGSNDVVYVTT